jgi:hypothetical protein
VNLTRNSDYCPNSINESMFVVEIHCVLFEVEAKIKYYLDELDSKG